MITALLNDERVRASQMENRTLNYRCPSCGGHTILVKGKMKVHHFRHEAKCECDYYGETINHAIAKEWLFNKLTMCEEVECVEAECTRFDGIRPDIAFKYHGVWGGVEFQKSGITHHEVQMRTLRYYIANVRILWVITDDIYKKAFHPGEIKLSRQNRDFIQLHDSLFAFTGDRIRAIKYNNVWRDDYFGRDIEYQLETVFTVNSWKDMTLNDLCVQDKTVRLDGIQNEYGITQTVKLPHLMCTDDDGFIKFNPKNFGFNAKNNEWYERGKEAC